MINTDGKPTIANSNHLQPARPISGKAMRSLRVNRIEKLRVHSAAERITKEAAQ